MVVKKISFSKDLLDDYFSKNNLNKNKNIYIGDLSSKKLSVSGFDKYLLFSAENMFNKVGLSNIITRFSFSIFNRVYNFIPNILLIIPIWFPYKKHFKLMKNKNIFFVLTNKINSFSKNILSFPLFIYRYRSYYSKYLDVNDFTYEKKKFCAFIVSNPSNHERLDFYKKLSKYKKIDSFGKIFKNADFKIDDEVRHLSNFKIYKDYKFVICFENSYEEDYITEKLVNVMMGGSIPIYMGAPNVNDYFNSNSFINCSKFKSFDEVINLIIKLDNDDVEYNKLLNEPWLKKNNRDAILKKEAEFNSFLDMIFK